MKTLAIDFDGVLHDHLNPIPGRRMGLPLEGAKDAMQLLRDKGHKLIVHSVWGNKGSIIEAWMTYHGIVFDEITNIKPDADIYLDDKGMKFINWQRAITLLE